MCNRVKGVIKDSLEEDTKVLPEGAKVQSRYDLAASLTFCTFNRETCEMNFYQKMLNKAKL